MADLTVGSVDRRYRQAHVAGGIVPVQPETEFAHRLLFRSFWKIWSFSSQYLRSVNFAEYTETPARRPNANLLSLFTRMW